MPVWHIGQQELFLLAIKFSYQNSNENTLFWEKFLTSKRSNLLKVKSLETTIVDKSPWDTLDL